MATPNDDVQVIYDESGFSSGAGIRRDKRAVVIEVPALPPKECSPNARVHWAARYKAGKKFKEVVGWSARASIPNLADFVPMDKAEMSLTFVVAEKRIHDADNFIARFKPGQDALVTMGLLAQDDINHLTVTGIKFEVDKTRAPMTIIKLIDRSESNNAQ